MEDELIEDPVVRFYRTTVDDAKQYNVQYFNLSMVAKYYKVLVELVRKLRITNSA